MNMTTSTDPQRLFSLRTLQVGAPAGSWTPPDLQVPTSSAPPLPPRLLRRHQRHQCKESTSSIDFLILTNPIDSPRWTPLPLPLQPVRLRPLEFFRSNGPVMIETSERRYGRGGYRSRGESREIKRPIKLPRFYSLCPRKTSLAETGAPLMVL